MIHAFIRAFLIIALARLSLERHLLLHLPVDRSRVSTAQASQTLRSPDALFHWFHSQAPEGKDPEIYESFRSHCLQDYPEYEIIFGVSDPADPAVASVEWLQQEFPDMQHSVGRVSRDSRPQCEGQQSRADGAVRPRYGYLIVNDSDIRVESDYLRRVIAPLAIRTWAWLRVCIAGLPATTVGSQIGGAGDQHDFCSSVLVAEQVERGLHFGLGSTLAFRRSELNRIGGFKSIVDFLADDYELGRRIAGLGLKIVLSDVVVETHLPAYDLRDFLMHQLRWARGVRDARRGGYIGFVSTFGIAWALIAVLAAGASPWSWLVLAAMLLLRSILGLVVMQKRFARRGSRLNAVVVAIARLNCSRRVDRQFCWTHRHLARRPISTQEWPSDPHLMILDQFETAVGKQPVAPFSPQDRVSEKTGDPEAEPEHIFQRQQQPVNPGPQHAH